MAKDSFKGFTDDDETIVNEGNNENNSNKGQENKGQENNNNQNNEGDGEDPNKKKEGENNNTNKKTGKENEGNEGNEGDEGNEGNEGKGDEGSKGNDGKGNEGNEGNENDEGNDEFSDELKLEDVDEGNDDEKPIDYLETARELELDLTEEEKEVSKETFIEKVKNKIEASKQVFNYQNIPADVLDVVKFFAEEGGTTADLLANHDVVLAEVYLSMEDKAKFVRFQSDRLTKVGLDETAATERATEMWDQKTEKDQAQAIREIDASLIAFKDNAIKEVVAKRKEIVTQQKAIETKKAEAEKAKMVSIVKGMTEYMGMKISKETNDLIVKRIEKGEVDKILNSSLARARVNAMMMELFGKQIQKNISKTINDSSREGYNKGVNKFIEKNHNTRPDRKEKGQQADISKKRFDFTNIDDE